MDVSRLFLYFSSMIYSLSAACVESVNRTPCSPDWEWIHPGWPADRTLNLWLVTAGKGTMTIRGHTYPLGPGDCFYIRMREPCFGHHDRSNPLTVYWAIISYPKSWTVDDARLPSLHRKARDLRFLIRLFDRSLAAFQEDDAERSTAWLQAVMLALREQDQLPPQDARHAEQFQRLLKIGERIRREPGARYSIPELARECHCTPGHFTRIFTRWMRSTPRDFIVNARVESAKSLLRISNQKISSIAAALGYGDLFHFSRQFTARTGITPSDYRKGVSEMPARLKTTISFEKSNTTQ